MATPADHCTDCGSPVEEGWKHCRTCGVPLGPEGGVPESSSESSLQDQTRDSGAGDAADTDVLPTPASQTSPKEAPVSGPRGRDVPRTQPGSNDRIGGRHRGRRGVARWRRLVLVGHKEPATEHRGGARGHTGATFRHAGRTGNRRGGTREHSRRTRIHRKRSRTLPSCTRAAHPRVERRSNPTGGRQGHPLRNPTTGRAASRSDRHPQDVPRRSDDQSRIRIL